MSSSRFLRSGLNWARNSHGHRGFAIHEDLGSTIVNHNRNDRKKRKRADSSKSDSLLVGNDLLDSAFLGIGGIGAELPSLDVPFDGTFGDHSENEFSFSPLEDTFSDSLGLDQDIASALSTPFPMSPQITRTKKRASGKPSSILKTQEPLKKRKKESIDETQEVECGDKRGRKNFRERQRRETMKKKFDELTRLIENDEIEESQIPKMKKMDVLSKAIGTIKDLQEQVQQFQMERYKMALILRQKNNGNNDRTDEIDGFLKNMDVDLNRRPRLQE